MFDHLFNPLMVGKVTLPNRICFLAHRTNFARGGRLDDRHVAYYRRRAQGGCGLIVVGDLSIHPNDRPWEAMIVAYDPGAVQDYQRLSGAVHEFESSIFAQLLTGSRVEKKGEMLRGSPESQVEGIISFLDRHGFLESKKEGEKE
ncbi:MAG: hypothetical protein H8D67_01140 [Deltaproteobacteria bacterium]|nr:hypothetical protein [Deltaproteobacteria bacterium]MBL7204813.1 hypothetical protein [Desulfobacteraceae bacterium]